MNDQLPEPLADLMFTAIDHAAESVRSGGPLVPFVMMEKAGQLEIERCFAETLEAGVEHARKIAKSELAECDRVAVAYDGYITIEEKRTDAVYVDAFEQGSEEGPRFALRYARSGLRRRNKPIGNPILLGTFPLE